MSQRSSTHGRNARGIGRTLAVITVLALALAVSPTALAKERGRPGTPSVAHVSQFFLVLRDQLRSVSWSD